MDLDPDLATEDHTSWLQCSYDGDSPPWALRAIPGKGYAAFATRNFKRGELICTERPTVWVHGHHPFDEAQVREIEERVNSLADELKRAFYDMANVFPESPTPATGIFMTNCFDMAGSAHGDSCAMYCALARLNHSCTPNTQQSHIPQTGEEVLYASRDIVCGEELNDCYIDLRQRTVDRRAALQDIYRFHCDCPACTACESEDDARRERAAGFDDLILAAAAEDGAEVASAIARDALRLLETAACLPWSIRYMPDALITVYQLAIASEQQGQGKGKGKGRGKGTGKGTRRSHERAQAVGFLRRAHELNLLLTGPCSPETARSAASLGEETEEEE